jgi:hypothetical protein
MNGVVQKTETTNHNLMKESSPIIVRMASNVEITNCTFSNNSAQFTGDYYFAASILLEKLFGTNMS